jgi:hypothetical protein
VSGACSLTKQHACGVYIHMSLVDSSMEPAAALLACINPPLLPLLYALTVTYRGGRTWAHYVDIAAVVISHYSV